MILRGQIRARTAAGYLLIYQDLMAILDEAGKVPGLLLARPPYLGLDEAGGNAWIHARVKNYIPGPIEANLIQMFDIELESIDPYWTRGDTFEPEPATEVVAITDTTWLVWRESWNGGALGGTPAGWEDLGFDDSAWATPHDAGAAGAGLGTARSITPQEAFTGTTLRALSWLARAPVLTLPGVPTAATLDLQQDDSLALYVNGVLAHSEAVSATETGISLDPALFVAGDNQLAFRCQNAPGNPSNVWIINPTGAGLQLTLTI
jgi:hypothetical protein